MTAPVTALPAGPRSRRWLLLLWLGLTVALVVAAANLPWRLTLQYVRQIEAGWLVAAVAANAAILPLWAAEWRLLSPAAFRVSFARMFEVVSVSAAVLNSVPFFAGEASGVAMLITRAGLSRGAALTVLALDQLMVGIAKLAVILAAAVAAPLPTGLRAGVLTLAIAVGALFLVLVSLAHRWEAVHARLLADQTKGRALVARVVALGKYLDALRNLRTAGPIVMLALAKKAAEVGAVLAIQLAFGLEPSLGTALLVVAALAVTTLVPVAPANLGVYEATVFAAYRLTGVPSAIALGLAIVQHVAFLLPPLAAGYSVVVARQFSAAPTRR